MDIIIQNVSEDKTTDFTFTVKREKSQETKNILSKLSKEFGGGEIELNEDISKVFGWSRNEIACWSCSNYV